MKQYNKGCGVNPLVWNYNNTKWKCISCAEKGTAEKGI